MEQFPQQIRQKTYMSAPVAGVPGLRGPDIGVRFFEIYWPSYLKEKADAGRRMRSVRKNLHSRRWFHGLGATMMAQTARGTRLVADKAFTKF